MAVLGRVRLIEDLVMRLGWVIENVVPGETEFPRASYPNTIIWIVVDGNREIEVNGVRHAVQAGEVVVIPPQTPRIVLRSDASSPPFRYFTIGCDIKLGPLNFVELYELPLITRITDSTAFADMAGRTAALLAQSLEVIQALHALNQPQLIISKVTTDDTLALLAVNASFHAWFVRFMDMMRDSLPDVPKGIDPRIGKLCSYMQLNLDRKLTLPELAQYMYVSESHLRLLFRKTMGISPLSYLRQLRLQCAKDLLVHTSHSLKEIAQRSGFGTLNHFSRTFKTYEAISPMEYRKRYHDG
ncbi:AraC family transcriptional regulator [Paenibacillus sp. 1P07SE]|uniref:AraC family transcriptional regulator n=1 Tax=Paenibacillus sp. 1P07SE TaxID=3132209 RepID=UPI0039A60D28